MHPWTNSSLEIDKAAVVTVAGEIRRVGTTRMTRTMMLSFGPARSKQLNWF
jgi:hypothetical protein